MSQEIKEGLMAIAKQLEIKNMIDYAYHSGQHNSMDHQLKQKIEKLLRN